MEIDFLVVKLPRFILTCGMPRVTATKKLLTFLSLWLYKTNEPEKDSVGKQVKSFH